MEPNYGTEILPMSSMAPLKEFKKERFVLFTLVWNNYDEALEESKLKSLKQ